MISVVAALFIAVVGANLVIDPQAVFGTGLFGHAKNANDRYERLLAYRAKAGAIDGVLFGSSRSQVIPLDEVSRRMDGARFASFAVVGGMLSDHLPTLEFIVRDKARRGERLKAVLLQLDIDALGNRPFTEQGLQYMLPPEISGEGRIRFWWKLLTSIQFKAWKSTIRGVSTHTQAATGTGLFPLAARSAAMLAGLAAPAPAHAQASPAGRPATPAQKPRERITQRADFPRQLALLQQLVALCRQNDIRLIAIAAPIGRASSDRLDNADLVDVVERVSTIVPLWDFTLARQANDHPEFWSDGFHFAPNIAAMMVDRIFGGSLPPEWADFGTFRSPVRQSEHLSRN